MLAIGREMRGECKLAYIKAGEGAFAEILLAPQIMHVSSDGTHGFMFMGVNFQVIFDDTVPENTYHIGVVE